MTKEKFNELVDDIINTASTTLKTKNAKYAPADDALHNFHYGAQLDNSTTAQTIWHYMKKHMVALLDKINRDDWEDIDDAKEKIQDIINYLVFIWCAANENYKEPKEEYEYDEIRGCENCRYVYIGSEEIEPCAFCKCNFIYGTEEFNDAKFNWQPIE